MMEKNARMFIKVLIKDDEETLIITIFILSSVSRPNRSLTKFELNKVFLFENNSSKFCEQQLIKLTWDYDYDYILHDLLKMNYFGSNPIRSEKKKYFSRF